MVSTNSAVRTFSGCWICPNHRRGPDEARIRVHAAVVSPADVLLPTGGHTVRVPDSRPPFMPGMDAAGGGYAVELTKVDGPTVIADAAGHDAELVRGLGADHAVEHGTGVATRIRALAPEGVATLVDGSM